MTEKNKDQSKQPSKLGFQVSQYLKSRKGKLLPEEENEIPAILNSIDSELFHFKEEQFYKEGGEKIISRAHDTRGDRIIAIARPRNSASDHDKEAFLREARITSKLQHPNILPVYEIGLDNADVPYFVMRFLEGNDLGAIIKEVNEGKSESVEVYSLDILLGIFLKLCDAMIYAHSNGVLHLDIKPSNVMIGRYGQVHLLDWGLSVVTDSGMGGLDPDLLNTVTHAGSMQGTPGYMAPEQMSGLGKESVSTDVYSLGAVLYFMLTGTVPVKGKDAAEVQNNTRAGRVVPPSKRRPNLAIPESLSAIAMKALAQDPDNRYGSVQELYDDVSRFLRGFAPVAERAGPIKRLQLLVKRHNEVSTALLLAGVVLVSLFAVFLQRERLQSRKLEKARTEAVQNLDRFLIEQELSQELYGRLLGFTGNVAAYSDVTAFPDAYRFMCSELEKENLSSDYRNRLLWNKTQLELANQQFTAAMETIRECELDRGDGVFNIAKKYAQIKPDDSQLLAIPDFVQFLDEGKGSILTRRFRSILLALAFDLDSARRSSPDPEDYLKVILSHLNNLNNTPGWGNHVALQKLADGYHLNLSDAPYIRYRLARMAPEPLFEKLQLASLNLSRNQFRLEDSVAFTGKLNTLVLLDVETWDMDRFLNSVRKIPATRLVFRRGFLSESQVERLRRNHEVIELAPGDSWPATD